MVKLLVENLDPYIKNTKAPGYLKESRVFFIIHKNSFLSQRLYRSRRKKLRFFNMFKVICLKSELSGLL